MKKRNLILGAIVVVLVYFLGIATGHYQLPPFNLLFNIKNELGIKDSKRNLDVSSLKEVEVSITNDTGVYLTYGQSNSANHGQIGYDVNNEVYQFLDNQTYIYKDPSLGGTGTGGSVWGMVGDKLIDKGIHDKVIFSNNGWQGRSLEELINPPFLTYLIKSFHQMKNKYGRINAILFHQGEINHSDKLGHKEYYKDFEAFMQKLKEEDINVPVYLSRTSICENSSDSTLIKIQNKIIEDFDLVLKGPNTDLLYEKKYRLPDYCHFSLLGFEKFSDMWVESLTE